MSAGVTVPIEAIVTLRRRLAALPARHPERQPLMASTAELYDISRATLYRLLRGERRPKDAHRADRGLSRTMPAGEIEWWCEVVAAMKSRTTNRQGRRLSTKRILEIVTEHGVETPDRGLVKLPPGRLAASTLNRHMRQCGYDIERMTREPTAVRYQAERANMLWHFDMSPSDLKQLKAPTWIDPDRNGAPTLMLFSVVDDRSGVVYQEYALVYGEDAEAALRFLFRAMAPKADNPFEGIPENIQLDGGPVGKSSVFKRVMECLGITVTPHMPAGSDGRRTTARAKGKVERPFRTVKEAHETLYHFHEPTSEDEANRWLARYIATYNSGDHRREPHSRIDDWLGHLPDGGIRAMCSWERYCAFAREPERRKVGLDCRLTVAGVTYEVTSEVAGETVVVWWGLFDQELWVEHGDERYGPFDPVGGPVPLHRYRKHRKSRREVRADRVDALATRIGIPRSVLTGKTVLTRRLREELEREGRVIVSRALSLEKAKISVPLLVAALFYDLSSEKTVSIPSQSERRERDLQELFRKAKRPVALFVDDAHDLHPKTLTALKRLVELVTEGGGQLAVILVGHPKLRNDLKRPLMEEIGDRTTVFEFGGLRDRQRDYIDWALRTALLPGIEPDSVLTEDAAVLLAAKLKTPLQIGRHLVRAFEAGFEASVKPIDAATVEGVLSRQIDDLEPQLTRHGYDTKSLADQFDAKPAEIRQLLRGGLDPARARELTDDMRAAGLPL